MGKVCLVADCDLPSRKKGYCHKHHWRVFHGSGDPSVAKKSAPSGSGHLRYDGYRIVRGRSEHVLKAEKALGKKLPKGAVVHHVDGNKGNNVGSNLVVCPDQAYHSLLEVRTKAFLATGDANKRKCWICKNWDLPTNLRIRQQDVVHKLCMRNYSINRRLMGV